jgi:multimeric flavodoxin WrbA
LLLKTQEDHMNVVGICGSFRSESNTNKIVKRIAESSGHQYELIYLGSLDIGSCTGCLTCMFYNGQCAVEDDMQALYDKIMGADAMIIGSPVYYMNISGAVKCFLDRKFSLYFRGIGPPGSPYTGQRPLAGKPAVAVVTVAGSGHERAMTSLRRHFEINKMNIVAELAEVVGMNDVEDMPEVLQRANDAGRILGKAMKEGAS